MGRPRIHASQAERQAAYRATKKAATISAKRAEAIASIAEVLGQPQTEVLDNLLRFALTNRNWKQLGLMGRKDLPHDAE